MLVFLQHASHVDGSQAQMLLPASTTHVQRTYSVKINDKIAVHEAYHA